MALYKTYPAHVVFLRRAFAVVAGVAALPVMLFWKDRARYYSWLHLPPCSFIYGGRGHPKKDTQVDH